MRKFHTTLLFMILLVCAAAAQDNQRSFRRKTVIRHTPVSGQGSTGTCWSFATTSFLESEIMRKKFPETNLSEMFFVYHAYLNKAKKYLLYYGNNNFSQGGQAHDVMNVLHEHVGKLPRKIKTPEGNRSPEAFRDHFDLNPEDYVELTSFNHHPFYKPFALEVPDNWSHASYVNLPVDELVEVMIYALENGHTVCWDGDTSEETFSHKNGIADLPAKLKGKVSQETRQKTFFNRTTTDDHLMHIVGLYEDRSKRPAFFTKNSWGADSNDYNGYLMLTEDYVRLKTIAILVHKEAIPESIKQKIKL